MPCTQSGYDYRDEYRCGGPVDRQCCAPAFKPTTTLVNTPETLPPTFSPPSTPSDGLGAGAIAGIVIGLLTVCTVLAAGYHFNQKGNPFAPPQQSFHNLNNEENSDGVIDGIANPLGDMENVSGRSSPTVQEPTEGQSTTDPYLL